MKENLELFSTGFVQVFFVAINTYFLSKGFFAGVFICGFMISFVWSWNVKKVAFGAMKDRLSYAIGAGFGSLIGLVISKFIV